MSGKSSSETQFPNVVLVDRCSWLASAINRVWVEEMWTDMRC